MKGHPMDTIDRNLDISDLNSKAYDLDREIALTSILKALVGASALPIEALRTTISEDFREYVSFANPGLNDEVLRGAGDFLSDVLDD